MSAGRRSDTGDAAPESVLSRRQVDRRILAAAIHLEVELKLVALVELTHPRTLDRTDVHERIRLAVITRDKAEALHRVEELDRTGRLLTRQFALRRSRLGGNGNHIANNLEIGRRYLAAAINEVELQLLALGQAFKARTFDRADVDKHVLTAVVTLDEAEALLRVEKLDDTLARTDDLSRHPAATAAARTTGTAKAAATTARGTAAAEAAAITAAKAATITAAAEPAAITAAEAATGTAAAKTAAITAAETATAAATAAAVRIEAAFVTETIALVASATPPPSVKTHKNQ